jgi:CO/xanthine dehydrogenase FAD-binding subunit
VVDGYVPTSLAEALEIRAEKDVTPYAGGTDLMIRPDGAPYLFLHRIPELGNISRDGEYIRFGAGCTFAQLLDNRVTPGILRDALALIAAPAIRSVGTIGGNIGNGSAKADSALIFFVSDSKLRLASARGERTLPIEDFYLGRKKLDLKPDELIVEILMPHRWLDCYCYKKIGARKALAISRLSFAGLMSVNDGRIAHCAASFGAVSEVIIRRRDLDSMLIGRTMEEAREAKAAYIEAYDRAIVPIRGRVSSEYRKTVCLNLLRDFLERMGV